MLVEAFLLQVNKMFSSVGDGGVVVGERCGFYRKDLLFHAKVLLELGLHKSVVTVGVGKEAEIGV
jgi:hypothetical protein